jgi:hypothetical protein
MSRKKTPVTMTDYTVRWEGEHVYGFDPIRALNPEAAKLAWAIQYPVRAHMFRDVVIVKITYGT